MPTMGETDFADVVKVANSVQEQALRIQKEADGIYVKDLAENVARLGSAVEATARKLHRVVEGGKIK